MAASLHGCLSLEDATRPRDMVVMLGDDGYDIAPAQGLAMIMHGS